MLKDIRFAFRQLLKQPAFTAIAIVTVALAIGANTAVLSLVNALLIRPLPYKAPNQLVLLWERFPQRKKLHAAATICLRIIIFQSLRYG